VGLSNTAYRSLAAGRSSTRTCALHKRAHGKDGRSDGNCTRHRAPAELPTAHRSRPAAYNLSESSGTPVKRPSMIGEFRWCSVRCVVGSSERRTQVRPQKVLVVDDNPGLRQLWSVWLSLWNFRVVEATDGCEAVETAVREQPALVLMDLAMPHLDGFAATRQLKQHAATATIPVVALTAHTSSEDRRRASEAGCAAFLGKPCDPDLLLKEVRRLLGRFARRL
jgi:two-component system cell cycle response regulator DivK